MKIGRRQLNFALGVLALILIGYSVLRFAFGIRLPERLDAELPNYVIFAALAVYLGNRKLMSDEKKAADAEKARLEREAVEALSPGDDDDAGRD